MISLRQRALLLALWGLPLYSFIVFALNSAVRLFDEEKLSLPEYSNLVLILSAVVMIVITVKSSPFFSFRKFPFNRKVISLKSIALIVTAGILFTVFYDITAVLLDHPIINTETQFSTQTYTALVLNFILIVFLAPLIEELFFRGHLWNTLKLYRGGDRLTLFLTSLIWAFSHGHYDSFERVMLFLFGLLLGAVRIRCSSVSLTYLLHSLVNFIAFIQMLILL